ncbi:hypothetical protein JOQ06_008094, partial [Pogonophryne albipinna]
MHKRTRGETQGLVPDTHLLSPLLSDIICFHAELNPSRENTEETCIPGVFSPREDAGHITSDPVQTSSDPVPTSSDGLCKLVRWAHSHGTFCSLLPSLQQLTSHGTALTTEPGSHGSSVPVAVWSCADGHAYYWPLSEPSNANGGSGHASNGQERFIGGRPSNKVTVKASCDLSNSEAASQGEQFSSGCDSSATAEDDDYEPHSSRKRCGATGVALPVKKQLALKRASRHITSDPVQTSSDPVPTSSDGLCKLVRWAHSHGTFCSLLPSLQQLTSHGTALTTEPGSHGSSVPVAVWSCADGHAYYWPLSEPSNANGGSGHASNGQERFIGGRPSNKV